MPRAAAHLLQFVALLVAAAGGTANYADWTRGVSVNPALGWPGGPPAPEAVIYGALHDPKAGHVRVWADLKGQNLVEVAAYVCELGSPGSAVLAPATVQLLANYRADVWTPVTLTCDSRALLLAPVTVVLHPGGQAVDVRGMHTNHVGRLAACVATLYSDSPSAAEWLELTRGVGVEQFSIYHGDATLNFSSFKAAIWGLHKVVEALQPFERFVAPSVSWHAVAPGHGRWSFGQGTAHSLCLYSLRYAFDYVMMLDTDEYMFTPGTSLVQFLDAELPHNVASAWFHRVTHNYCDVDYTPGKGSIFEQVATGTGESEQLDWFHGKSIVRPLLVDQFYVHMVRNATGAHEASVIIPQDKAFIKHVRIGATHNRAGGPCDVAVTVAAG